MGKVIHVVGIGGTSEIFVPSPQSYCERIISYKKRIASPGSMQDTGCLGLVHWDDPERCYGEGGGRGVQVWEHMYTHGGFMSMYGKTNTVL